jgi:hypothetical protein
MLTFCIISTSSLLLGQPQVSENPQTTVEKYVYGNDVDAGLRFYQGQDVDRWCWAATATMIMSFHGQRQWLQCIQADDSFPGKSEPRTCCDDKESPLCNRTSWPRFELYGFEYTATDVPLEWDRLREQIDNQMPLAVAVKFFSGGGHMGAVIGYQIQDDNEKYVLVVDPDGFHGPAILKFRNLFGTAEDGSYKHWRTYYNISK